jgi:hypothetical protein
MGLRRPEALYFLELALRPYDELAVNDPHEKSDAFIADKHRWPGDQHLAVMLALATKRAIERRPPAGLVRRYAAPLHTRTIAGRRSRLREIFGAPR